MAERVVLIKVRRPDQCNSRPFQICSLSATFSTNGCNANLGGFETANGIPRYWQPADKEKGLMPAPLADQSI
jgi:hypothetical protein